MSKCPKCKNEIDYLIAYSQCYQHFSVEDNGEANWSEVKEILETINFECPECGEVICETDDEAQEFLYKKKGKK